MPIDRNHPDYIELRDRIRENPKDFVVIIGAGLSRPAGLLSWSGLRDYMVQYSLDRISEIPDSEQDSYRSSLKRTSEYSDLWQAFSELKRILPSAAYHNGIKKKLTLKSRTKDIPQSYINLWKLGIKGILTFNIDTCALDSFSKEKGYAADSATSKDKSKYTQFLSSTHQFVFQPHGHIDTPDTWIFTTRERDNLLNNESYIDFTKALFHTKQLLILGFNPTDFSFQNILINSLKLHNTGQSRHYILLPTNDPSTIKDFSDKGLIVVPYQPDEPNIHSEIDETLQDWLSHTPTDFIPGSAYIGPINNTEEVPTDDELLNLPVDRVRELLNGAVASIIPPASSPKDDDILKLQSFYKKHIRAIHMAWLIEPSSECDIVHGYKVNDPIGRGAFGQVYEAEHISSGHRAAIKVLLPEVRHNPEYLNSFRRGVQSMRILTRHNIPRMVQIFDAYEVPACIVMEFIDGPTLTKAKQWGILNTLPKCLEVLVQIGETVHLAHNIPERVLHRDLKPDNIILKHFYNSSDDLDVYVLDFDLSWHKGALDLSVVHGARAQGYAAPEQTATVNKNGISTRHTGVDVFGYGMLGYFIFLNADPRPNEHIFIDFEEKLAKNIDSSFQCKWKCIPKYLAHIISKCTRDNQNERISFSEALEAFKETRNMSISGYVSYNNPLLIEELSYLISPDSKLTRKQFGRKIEFSDLDKSKHIEIELIDKNNSVYIQFTLVKTRSEFDDRNVAKYLPKAKDKTVSALNKSILTEVTGDIGQSRLIVSAKWPVTGEIDRSQVEEVATIVAAAKAQMTIG